jgi:rhodanese-related sulfurtransferase
MIGHPPKAMNVPWKYAPEWNINPRFSAKIKELIPVRDQTLLILCRSGQRSLEAAERLEHEGYTNLINITEGFEGPLDENKHRGNMGGWRFHKLPWVQN